ncbi:MAG: Nitrite reductase [Candidatus Brocadiaceae bacterium]|nr:Nitrite reductase [Candidatus Brocadiaceae bacterium]
MSTVDWLSLYNPTCTIDQLLQFNQYVVYAKGCNHILEQPVKARVALIQDCTKTLMIRAEEAVVALIHDLQQAQEFGMPAEQLKAAKALQRKAQWRLDIVAAENSMGFHAPQEAARILGEAIDYARRGQLEMAKLQSAAH